MEPDARSTRARSFGAHADAYDRARPGYPEEAARWLAPGSPRLVVELGAGTGKFTRALAALGLPVLAVEPDARMRAVLQRLDLPGVRAVDGSAETIPVGDGAADVVVSGSAFHWFDLDGVLAESARVLGPDGVLSFGWNRRDERDAAMAAFTALASAPGPRRWRGDRDWAELVPASGLFGPVEEATFEHAIELPRSGLGDLLRSYSRVGMLPPAEQEELERDALELFPDPVVRLPFVVFAFRTTARSTRSPAPTP